MLRRWKLAATTDCFRGKAHAVNLVGENPLPVMQHSVTPRGWMTTEVFENFLKTFAEKTKYTRLILLILDGLMTHLSLKTMLLGNEENISILKLPSHCTDLLQPLDVSCFAPLKSYYETVLHDHVHSTGARDPVRRGLFADLLCKVWSKGLSKDNVIAGFRATGIYPLDRTKYNPECLDPLKVDKYHKCISNGRPVDAKGQAIIMEDLPEPHQDQEPAACQ